ncbi:MAG TPA: amidohydrolase family protein [Prolixibacteraceae bacterium]|jgi:cytosine/adenosine deaminase-related metal-dependent hydrolase
MRKLSAHYIITGTGDVLVKGIIVLSDEGTVIDIIDTKGDLDEMANVEFYTGVLVPGFVNAHCHLELSHLRNIFPEKTGLPGFLKNVVEHRNTDDNLAIEAAQKADFELWKNGVVAVGDVSNTNTTFRLKSESKILYHTFIEVLGFSPQRAEKAFAWAQYCFEEAQSLGLRASVVPHAPYSISKDLFGKIAEFAASQQSVLSMHSQECKEEDDLYRSGDGEIVRHLTENLAIDLSFFEPTGKSALESVINWLPKENTLLLIHNIKTGQKDIDLIAEARPLNKTWFVLCPDSNLYIEDRLPDIELFRQNKLQICIGTDSLSSNRQLSMLEEMKTIQSHFPSIPLNEIVTWATRNGAEALEMGDWAGTIEVGKRPGINLITGMDLPHLKLLPQSKVKRLI